MIKVSVIVPVYNAEKYLAQCLDSILAQTLKGIEVVCVDDGSTDGSSKILDRYTLQDERVKVLYRENRVFRGLLNESYYDGIVCFAVFQDPTGNRVGGKQVLKIDEAVKKYPEALIIIAVIRGSGMYVQMVHRKPCILKRTVFCVAWYPLGNWKGIMVTGRMYWRSIHIFSVLVKYIK